MMQGSWSSLLLREATAIRIDLAQLGFPYHMTYVGPGLRLTYINLPSDPPKCELVLRYPRAQYSTSLRHSMMDSQDVYTLLSPSLHSQCMVVLCHNGIAEVLGLPEYVASTTNSQTQASLQWYGPQSTQARQAQLGEPIWPRTLTITSSPA